ncbi:MAG TPA: DNA cytosine methyltransferase [Verrucomicrobiae bacterium]|nr:DNA cytosine methyltransferase [Verrucomicrobiae bacterium]
MNCIELFTGAGGLALGVSRAGFKHAAVVERDSDSCKTLFLNQRRGVADFANWPIHHQDVCAFDFKRISKHIHLVAGGPPCQPFSLGGKHRGHRDERNLFPEAVRAVRELQPEAFLFENVKGLLRDSFSKYFSYILLQLKHPLIRPKSEETWEEHLVRLEKHETGGNYADFHYNVIFSLLNAADYGVPQRRERVFIVGIRADLGIEWSFPEKSHSQDALLWTQSISNDYWERHLLGRRLPFLTEKSPRIAQLKKAGRKPAELPWRTVRDAISDLPDPESTSSCRVMNHSFNPGARVYPGHTGSDYDEPAKVLKAGDHGVPGGENMLSKPDGVVRYFTVRESARLQTFPDKMVFPASWTESMRQIGNAVPVTLAETVAKQLAKILPARP